MPTGPVLTDMTPRLRAAGAAVVSARAAYEDELAIRDELIVKAVDSGMGQRQVARAVGLTFARVVAILLARTGE